MLVVRSVEGIADGNTSEGIVVSKFVSGGKFESSNGDDLAFHFDGSNDV